MDESQKSLTDFNSRHLHHFQAPSRPFAPMGLRIMPGVQPGMSSRAGSLRYFVELNEPYASDDIYAGALHCFDANMRTLVHHALGKKTP